MTKLSSISTPVSAIAVAVALGWSAPVMAQSAEDTAALRAEIAAMREQMAMMAQKIDSMEAEMAANEAETDAEIAAASAQATAATQTAAAAVEASEAASAPRVAELDKGNGWTFTPFGRLMIDAGTVNAPSGIVNDGLGFANEVRRARIGMKGDLPGGFGYKFELELADNDPELTDAILTYDAGGTTITIGQHNNFQGLEELTSSRFTSFLGRSGFTDAFGFGRRVGVSAQTKSGDFVVQGGVFTDSIGNLSDDGNNSWSADGRVVYAPKLGETQLHFGGSIHYRDFNDGQNSVRYRQRPGVHFSDIRFVNTGTFAATSEFGWGAEAALINGPFHATVEGFWQKPSRPGVVADPTFFGGYVEAGYFLTGGDTRGYKGGKHDRVKPANPVGEGGIGAVQVVARYDHLDLNDQGIIGGTQDNFGVSLIWTPTDYTRFMVNYIKGKYDDAAILAGTDSDYDVDTFGVRAQFDF